MRKMAKLKKLMSRNEKFTKDAYKTSANEEEELGISLVADSNIRIYLDRGRRKTKLRLQAA